MSLPCYTWNFDLIFCRQAKNNVNMDSAKFQKHWTSFGIFSNFPFPSTSENHKNYFFIRNFVPLVGFAPKNPKLNLGTITWERLVEK